MCCSALAVPVGFIPGGRLLREGDYWEQGDCRGMWVLERTAAGARVAVKERVPVGEKAAV